MTNILVSVIVVSRGRPDALVRCLVGIEQLFHQSFEVVVVADPPGVAALTSAGFSGRVKIAPFDIANISAARNVGVSVSAGDIVAFIDDDAVPEPTWLDALVAPFSDSSVMSAGGYVRGRNGISFQFRGAWVSREASDMEETLSGRFETEPGHAVKTMGTNCAFRRQALVEIGGFDEAFRFYLDETDVNMRLAVHRFGVAMVPGAEVHHGFHASTYRAPNRVPRSLFQIGASLAVFLRKHFDGSLEKVFARARAAQRKRLDAHLIAGNCEARDVRRLMQSLENGFAAGQFRALQSSQPMGAAKQNFLPFVPRRTQGEPRVIAGRFGDQGLWVEALNAAERGERISLFRFSPTALYHRVRFVDGVWVQTGGLWGRSDRVQPIFQASSRSRRLKSEIRRVARQRGIPIDDSAKGAVKIPLCR